MNYNKMILDLIEKSPQHSISRADILKKCYGNIDSSMLDVVIQDLIRYKQIKIEIVYSLMEK